MSKSMSNSTLIEGSTVSPNAQFCSVPSENWHTGLCSCRGLKSQLAFGNANVNPTSKAGVTITDTEPMWCNVWLGRWGW